MTILTTGRKWNLKLGSGTAVINMFIAEFKKLDLNFGGTSATKKFTIINEIL